MSWFFGISSLKDCSIDRKKYSSIHPTPNFIIDLPILYLAFGGIPETCIIEKQNDTSGWAVVGLGIMTSFDKARLMKKKSGLLLSTLPIKYLSKHLTVILF